MTLPLWGIFLEISKVFPPYIPRLCFNCRISVSKIVNGISADHKNKSGSSSKSGSKSSSSSSGKNLWVSGLASSTRAQDLKSVFSKYGRVSVRAEN